MAEYTKEFYIKIGGIKESVENMQTLEGVLDKVEKQVENINKNGGFTVVSKEANKNTKEAIDLAKAQKIANDEVVSSYRDKQKALTALGKEIKTMVAEDEQSIQKQGELIGQYNELNTKLKNFDAAMGNHQRSVGDYRGALRETTQQIKEMQGEMAQMLMNGINKADPAFQALAKRAGELQDAISDAREETKRFASDTKQLDDVINVAQSATAAFQLYKGVMSEFGIENKKAEETIASLMQTASMLQSLQTLSNTLKEGSATAKIFQGVMKALGGEMLATQAASIKATVAQEGLSTAQKVGAVASKTLGLAMKTIPLVLIISLVLTLISNWERLVGWFTKTFPVVKKLGGVFNAFKATIMGVGKAILNWLVNPIETFVKVVKRLFAGDFTGALEAVKEGITKQFKGTAEAFKTGFKEQVEKGLEEITQKQATEADKMLTHQKNMITKQKNADGTYRKEYIEANKKMFENRKKMYKKDSDEYRKVLEEEAAFYQQVEDAKTAAAKKGAKEREKAAKEAAKAIEEEQKRIKETHHELSKSILDTGISELKILEELEKQRLETYKEGPIEKYTEQLKKLQDVQGQIKDKENAKVILDISKNLEDNVKSVKKVTSAWTEFLGETVKLNEEQVKEKIDALGLSTADVNLVLTSWQKLLQMQDQISLEYLQKIRDNEKQAASIVKAEVDDSIKAFEKRYKELIDKVESMNLERPVRDKIFGLIDTGKTLANLEILKGQWEGAYADLRVIIDNQVKKWEDYLERVKKIYGEDSNQFKKAQKEKEEALDPLLKKLIQVKETATGATSTEKDYTGDGKAGASTKPNKKLWYGKGDKKSNGDPYSFIDNMANMFDQLDEMVLAPAMDTFSMFMDFAIEETAQKLEEVQKLHDDALDKVNESADKIKELNDSLKDSSNTNLEATKQQLADEQLLYAQRLAEEKKLAEQEKALKNKQAQQEANARKMELRYQMVMAIANTAQGASKALADWGWPLGAVFAGIMAALGAIQVALIAKQIGAIKPIKYAEGGLLQGPSHSQGGIPIGRTGVEVEGNEYVVNKRSTAKYLPLLEAINAEGRKKSISNTDKRIRRYANGGQLNFDRVDENLRENNNTNRLMNAIDKIDMQPVVAVKDIWKVEDRLVKVRSLAGK